MSRLVGTELLEERVRKMESVPLHKRPYDVQRFVEAYRLLDGVVELLPEPVLPATEHCSAVPLPATPGPCSLVLRALSVLKGPENCLRANFWDVMVAQCMLCAGRHRRG
jgi:hypothetical protein